MIEGLELRRLLATVGGTGGADAISVAFNSISNQIVITVNGTPNNFADGTNNTIVINAGAGNDTISVNGNGAGNLTTINGGDGDDSIIVGNGDYDLNILAALVVNGDVGADDVVRVNDVMDAAGADAATITQTTFAKTGSQVMTYASLEGFTLDAGNAPESLSVASTATGVPVTVNAGGGNDSLFVGGNDFDLNIRSPVTLNGGANTDLIRINDEFDTGDDTYTLDTTFTKNTAAAAAVVTTSSGEQFDISSPFGLVNSTFNIVRYLDGLVIAGGGDGNDTFNVGGGDYDTNLNAVEIQADAGVDVVNYDDSLDGGGVSDTYDIFATSIQKGAVANLLTYSASLEGLVLTAGTANDLFNVNATTATIPITINAGDGDDTLDAGGAGNNLDGSVVNATTFNGGLGTDRVDLDDSGGPNDTDTYTLGGISLVKNAAAPFGALAFDAAVEEYVLIANNGNNVISSGSFFGAQSVTVNGGGGNDTINSTNVNDEVENLATQSISGGADSDSWVINESGDVGATAYRLTFNTFQVTGGDDSGVITYDASFESISITASNQPTTFFFDSYDFTPLTLNLSGGNDTLVIGDGDLQTNFESDLTINGGDGADSLVVDDTTDGPAANTLVLTNGRIDKASVLIDHLAFEAQEYQGNTQATLISIDSTNIPTTITGGTGGETITLTPTGKTLQSIAAPLVVNGGGGSDSIVVDDVNNFIANTYTLTATTLAQSIGTFGGLAYAGVEQFRIAAGVFNQTFNVDATAAGTNYLINTGDSNDTVNLGGTDGLADGLDGPISLNGGIGNDVLNYNDQANTVAHSYSFDVGAIARTGQALVSYAEFDGVTLNAGTGSDTATVASLGLGTSLTVNTGTGFDSVTVGAGDLDDVRGPVTLVGGSTTLDRFTVNDSADAANLATGYAITANTFSRSGAGTTFGGLVFDGEIGFLFDLNQSGTPISYNDSSGGASLFGAIIQANGGIDTITVVNAPTSVTVRGGAGLDVIEVNSDAVDVATVAFDQNEDFQEIINRVGGLITFVGDIAVRSVITTIANVSSGVINFNRGTLVATNPALGTYVGALERGYNGGAWNGAANASFRSGVAAGSAVADALGYAAIGSGAGQLNVTNIHGVPVTAGDIVVTYTLAGDANLDRTVNFDDLLALAQNYAPAVGNRSWTQGNFNYNTPDTAVGAVGFDDLLALAQNYNASALSDAPTPAKTTASTRRRVLASGDADPLVA